METCCYATDTQMYENPLDCIIGNGNTLIHYFMEFINSFQRNFQYRIFDITTNKAFQQMLDNFRSGVNFYSIKTT